MEQSQEYMNSRALSFSTLIHSQSFFNVKVLIFELAEELTNLLAYSVHDADEEQLRIPFLQSPTALLIMLLQFDWCSRLL